MVIEQRIERLEFGSERSKTRDRVLELKVNELIAVVNVLMEHEDGVQNRHAGDVTTTFKMEKVDMINDGVER